MRVIQSKFTPKPPIFLQTWRRAPGALVLDPPLGTKPTKQHVQKKHYSQSKETKYTMDHILWFKDLGRSSSESSMFINWNCVQCTFISKGVVCLLR